MQKHVFSLLIAALCCGCGGNPQLPTETVAATPRPIPPPPPIIEINPALILDFANGDLPTLAAVDPARGVDFFEYASAPGEDPRADASGMVRVAKKFCDAELTLRLDVLRSDLKRRVGELVEYGDDANAYFRCEEMECRFDGMMEYDLGGAIAFENTPEHGTVLVSVFRYETALVTEAFFEDARAWAQKETIELDQQRCP